MTEPADIAIIGLSGRFPGAKNVQQFWDNLSSGVESIRFFTEAELSSSGIDRRELSKQNYIKAKGYLEGSTLFDAAFFGVSDRDAMLLDPQFRILLEESYSALENAAYVPENYSGHIGLFVGASSIDTYYEKNLLHNPRLKEVIGSSDESMLQPFNSRDFLASFVAYNLNLTGPCFSIQTACSTSLVSVASACDSLRLGACDMALAGGVFVSAPSMAGYEHKNGMPLSKDGHCRAFDASASGMVAGNGVGIVVLKKLDKAIADRDHIHAVIKGYAVNNDGNDKIGFFAPSVKSQAAVIRAAIASANLKPADLTYIESHGTGTSLGDPIEVAALQEVFGDSEVVDAPIKIGAVKPNIGHLDVAAGVAGLIKVVESLKHETIAPNINFAELNPEISILDTSFEIPCSSEAWVRKGGANALYAGVSAFGMGGTNAHMVLASSPSHLMSEAVDDGAFQLVVLSAKQRSGLIRLRRSLVGYIAENPSASLREVAHTLRVGRKQLAARFACICSSKSELVEMLEELEQQDFITPKNVQERSDVNFIELAQVASQWLAGELINWNSVLGEINAHKVPLPSYPFEGKEYWLKRGVEAGVAEVLRPEIGLTDVKRIESDLTELYRKFFGSDKVRPDNDIFELGGDSLLVLQIIAQIKKDFDVELEIDDLEKFPTAALLAEYLHQSQEVGCV